MRIVSCEKTTWSPTPYTGVYHHWLKKEENVKGGTALIKIEKDASLPKHKHPGYEKIILLEGRLLINDNNISPNTLVLLDANTIHYVKAIENSIYMTVSEMDGVSLE